MKQHSYAFYNGHLSTLYQERELLCYTRGILDQGTPEEDSSFGYSTSFSGPSSDGITDVVATSHHAFESEHAPAEETAIDEIIEEVNSEVPLSPAKIASYKVILEDEISQLTKELVRNTTAPERAYPNNLTISNLCEYLVFPTVVYELEYPRSESINWGYVLEKTAATLGVLFVMNMVSQTFICKSELPTTISSISIYLEDSTYIYSSDPVVMKAVSMKEMGMPLTERLQEFPWMLSELIFPFMMEYLVSAPEVRLKCAFFANLHSQKQLTWFLIWETILNVLAELTRFADRSFYDDWWNSGKF